MAKKPKIYASIEDNGKGEYQVAWHGEGITNGWAVYWNSAATHDADSLRERFVWTHGGDYCIQWC